MDNELEVIRDQVKRYLNEEVQPEQLKRLLDEPGGFDRQLWIAAVEMGWPALSAPEAAGGLGLGWRGLAVLAEELGRKAVSLPLIESAVVVRAILAAGAGTEAAGLVPALVAGEQIACLAFAEAAEAGLPACPAVTYSNGKVTGRKALAPFAAVADHALIHATSGDGVSLLLVALDQAEVTRKVEPSIDNARGVAALSFAGARAIVLGDGGPAQERIRDTIALAVAATAFEQVGGAQACMEMARDYALERIAFGQPIGRFQAIKHKLADMYWRIEVARGCALDAVEAIENGDPLWAALAAAARVGAIDAYEFSARENIQTHGGLGVTWEAMPQHYYRRSRVLALEQGGLHYWREQLLDGLGFSVPNPDQCQVSA